MRKEYGQALRQIFSQKMKQSFPQFAEVNVKSLYFGPGERAYRWIPREPLHCWLVLSPHPKDLYEQFNILVGWSKKGRYPECMVPCPELPSVNQKEFAAEEYMTRLPYLWTDTDTWWEIEKLPEPGSIKDIQKKLQPVNALEAKKIIEPLVEDAVSKIEKFGLPYLKKFSDAMKNPK